jgi:spermidine/putrescine transport system substrate-binding protein
VVSKEERQRLEERIEHEAARYGMSRSQFLKWSGVLAAAATVTGRGASALAAPARLTAADAEHAGGTLTWLSWPGHNDKSFIGPFEKEYKVKVRGKEYSGGDNMLALATTAAPGTFDVVQADAEYISQLRKAGLLVPLDPKEFPEVNQFFPEFGLKGTQKSFSGLWFEGKPYAFIMRFGLLELAYNTKYVTPQDAQSYRVLWSPKLKGKVGWFDWWAHMGPIGLYVGNRDPYNVNQAGFDKMVKAVDSLKPQTAGFYSIADLFNVFSNEEIYIQPAGGDWTALLLEQQGHPIRATTPKEGAIQWTETLGIFKSAKNPDLAKEFIRYALGPRGQVQTAILPAYQANIPNRAAWTLMNKEKPGWAKRLRMDLKGPNILTQYHAGRIKIRKLPVQQPIKVWDEAWTKFKNL